MKATRKREKLFYQNEACLGKRERGQAWIPRVTQGMGRREGDDDLLSGREGTYFSWKFQREKKKKSSKAMRPKKGKILSVIFSWFRLTICPVHFPIPTQLLGKASACGFKSAWFETHDKRFFKYEPWCEFPAS